MPAFRHYVVFMMEAVVGLEVMIVAVIIIMANVMIGRVFDVGILNVRVPVILGIITI
jgi:hypothetical protein